MKKKTVALLSVVMACALSLSAFGCGGNGDNGNTNSGNKPQSPVILANHDFTAPDTDKYVLKDGRTDYKLVIPNNATEYLRVARDEFVTLFFKATGVAIQCIEDTEAVQGGKYISIGETSLFKESGISIDKAKLDKDGVRIVTKGENIYLVGGSDSGSLYSVYDFMSVCFNYEQYFSDCMEIDTGIKELKLKNFNVTDIPDIALRAENYGFLSGDGSDYDAKMFGYRMRMDKSRGEYMMPIFREFNAHSPSQKSTNSDYYLPPETYLESHPKWYSDACLGGENQLCYTAHGDAEEYKLMLEECAKKIEFSMMHFTPKLYPDMNVVTLTMMDNYNCCDCNACIELATHYGTESGAPVIFMNDLGALVEEWQNDPENAKYKRDDLRIIFFAYNNFENSPTKYNEQTKKYEPIDEKVVIRDNVGVYLAICNNLEFQKSFFDDMNGIGRGQLDSWSVLSDFVYYWNYETNFKYYMYYYDSFAYFNAEAYRYFYEKNVKMFFAQGQESCGETGTTWNNLKAYLNAKLSWNTALDTQTLMDNWFKAMYQDCAPAMKNLFLSMRAHNNYFMESNALYRTRSNYLSINKREYWPLATLQQWVATCDEALASAEKYKEMNQELYTSLCKHIEAEAVSPLYLIASLYKNQLSSTYLTSVKDRLLTDISFLHLETKKTSEHGITIAEDVKAL